MDLASAAAVQYITKNFIICSPHQLPGQEFDISEDLDSSLELFTSVLRAKDEEIELLNLKVLSACILFNDNLTGG